MTVGLFQSVFVVPAICVVARERGCYAAEGVSVTDVFTTSSNAQRIDLDRGRVDVAITSTDNLAPWAIAGSDVVQVAQIETTTDLALVLRAGRRPMTSDRRVRLAVDAPTNGFAILAYAMLRKLGLAEADYDVVEVGGVRERFDALLAGHADATLVAPPLDEQVAYQGMKVLLRTADLVPEYPGLGVVASRAHLDDRTDAVRRYVAALERARRWIAETAPHEVAELLASVGHGPRAIETTLRNNPASLRSSTRGLQVLADLRSALSMSVVGAPAVDQLTLNDHPVLAPLP